MPRYKLVRAAITKGSVRPRSNQKAIRKKFLEKHRPICIRDNNERMKIAITARPLRHALCPTEPTSRHKTVASGPELHPN